MWRLRGCGNLRASGRCTGSMARPNLFPTYINGELRLRADVGISKALLRPVKEAVHVSHGRECVQCACACVSEHFFWLTLFKSHPKKMRNSGLKPLSLHLRHLKKNRRDKRLVQSSRLKQHAEKRRRPIPLRTKLRVRARGILVLLRGCHFSLSVSPTKTLRSCGQPNL